LLERLFALETFGIKLGLDNIRSLCTALDHPERAFIPLHIAGTNGKGSVTAMVHAALVAAGIETGRYTSPHLVHVRERFVINRTAIDDAALEDVATQILDCADQLRREGLMAVPPTFFEATTMIGFELFRRRHVKAAVIEVGLGGRFDATNVLDPPVGAITSIALDHQQHLGDTIEQIAFEKAGIIKPGMLVVTAPLPEGAARVVERIAAERGARVVDSFAGVHIDSEMREGRAHMTVETPQGRYGPLRLALRGEHQIRNAVVAVRVLEAARQAALDVPADAIVHGLETVDWPARLEVIPLRDGGEVLLDAAHNAEGARALRAYLARWYPDPPALVVGIMRDKDADAILRELLPVTSAVVATAADTARALPADDLAARVVAIDPARSVRVRRDVLAAVEAALESSREVCVAGSIFLVGAVREGLGHRDILQ
jgi:dihydrofolate synthase/folylpolyglutamate synthase